MRRRIREGERKRKERRERGRICRGDLHVS